MRKPDRPVWNGAFGPIARATAREHALIAFGHQDNVNSAAFSPDGRRIVTASKDGTARLWDAARRRAASATLDGHTKGHKRRIQPRRAAGRHRLS